MSFAPARRAPLTALLLLVAAVLSGCTGAQAKESRTGASPVAGEHSLRVEGRERNYLLKPATGLAKDQKAAVVVVLHQEGGTPGGVETETELAGLTSQGATLVYPAGFDRSWDAGECCGLPRREGIDDVAFVDAVLKDVASRTPVDRSRTAMVGYSSGGMLAYRYVCARPGELAAAVVVSGSLESPCAKDISVPDVLTLHGQKDGTIGLEKSNFVQALGLSPKPVNATLKELTSSAGCSAPTLAKETAADVYTWSGCRGGTVEARLIAGQGHGWGKLGASRQTQDFLRSQLLSGS